VLSVERGEEDGWGLGKKKNIKREGAPDCWLVFGQGWGQPLWPLFLENKVKVLFLFALYCLFLNCSLVNFLSPVYMIGGSLI